MKTGACQSTRIANSNTLIGHKDVRTNATQYIGNRKCFVYKYLTLNDIFTLCSQNMTAWLM